LILALPPAPRTKYAATFTSQYNSPSIQDRNPQFQPNRLLRHAQELDFSRLLRLCIMSPTARIYIAGHAGMVGSALVRNLESRGFRNLITRTRRELDLLDQRAVFDFLKAERPDFVVVAAARVGGILANNTQRGQFIYENLAIEAHLIHGSHLAGVDQLIFLGSSCIYPRDCPQPIREEYLLTGPLEPTNAP
jgi:GDP-L-fucose synthase